jgi:hypothetical protein
MNYFIFPLTGAFAVFSSIVLIDGSDVVDLHGYHYAFTDLGTSKVMESVNNQASGQAVLNAMSRTEQLILRLRENIAKSYGNGLFDESVLRQLNNELSEIDRSLQHEKATIEAISRQNPHYSSQHPNIFSVTPEEVNGSNLPISGSTH